MGAERALALKRLSRKRALDKRRAKRVRFGDVRGRRATPTSSGDDEDDDEANCKGAEDDDEVKNVEDGDEEDVDNDDESARNADADGDCGDDCVDVAENTPSLPRQAPIDCRRFVSIVCAPTAFAREERVALVAEVH